MFKATITAVQNKPELRRVFAIGQINGTNETVFLSLAAQRFVEPNMFGAATLVDIRELDTEGLGGIEYPTPATTQQILFTEGAKGPNGRRANTWGVITPLVAMGMRKYRASLEAHIGSNDKTSTPIEAIGRNGMTLWEIEATLARNPEAIPNPADSVLGGTKLQAKIAWQAPNAKGDWTNCADPNPKWPVARFSRAM